MRRLRGRRRGPAPPQPRKRDALHPPFFEARIRKDLGPLWDALPPGALDYEPNVYAESEMAAVA